MKNNHVKKALLAVLVGAMLAGMAGCGSTATESSDETTASSTTEVQEKVVTALVADGLNPELSDTIQSSEDMRLYEMVYEPLVKYGEGGEIEPGLAETWEISTDGTTYTFHLREDVKFSDGSDFNADSVVTNNERWTKDGFSSPLLEVNKINEYTVEFVFQDAAYPCLVELTYPRPYRMLGSAGLDNKGNFIEMVGTGAWMIESYEPDQEVVLVPNPYYYGEAPKVDKVILKQVSDGQSRSMALQSGEADISISDIPTENKSVIESDSSLTTLDVDGTLAFFLIENYENPKLADVRVRQALNYALDRQTLVDSLLDGAATPATGLMAANTPYVTDENSKGYEYDVEKAKQLLKEAGYEDTDGDGIVDKDGTALSFTLTFQTEEYSAWKSVCEYIQSEYAKAGIGIELNQVESGAYYDAIWDTRDFDLIIYRTYEDSWNPHGFIKGMFYQGEGTQAVCWYDESLSNSIVDVLKKTQEEEKQAGWDEIFKSIEENAYTVPLYYPEIQYVYNISLTGVEKAATSYEAIKWSLLDKVE